MKLYILLAGLISLAAGNVVNGSNRLAKFLFYRQYARSGNIVFCALSLHAALSLVQQGSSGNTAKAFQKILGRPDGTALEYRSIIRNINTEDYVTIKFANKIYVGNRYKLKDGFAILARDYFYAGIDKVNFTNSYQAAETINNWVALRTNGKIHDLVSPNDFNHDTCSFLLNTIYFEGTWAVPFLPHRTSRQKFYVSKNQMVDCEMMHQTEPLLYATLPNAQLLKIYYRDTRFSFIIALPNSKTDILDLEKQLQSIGFAQLTRNYTVREVWLSLPKFNIESTLELDETLKKMGLQDIFSSRANFSKMVYEKIYINKVVQKAFIDVNEHGTTATAATGVSHSVRLSVQDTDLPPITFTVDHPFIFFLTAALGNFVDTDAILFMGKVNVPNILS